MDSRPTDEGAVIRRRRECLGCDQRFTTYEKVEEAPLLVVKKDGRREPFDREKLMAGLRKACEKRPVSTEALNRFVDDIEADLRNTMRREVSSRDIGERVMQRLADLDEVAYVRFASVYRQFRDLTQFQEQLEKLLRER